MPGYGIVISNADTEIFWAPAATALRVWPEMCVRVA
jgi:hypothetical protein